MLRRLVSVFGLVLAAASCGMPLFKVPPPPPPVPRSPHLPPAHLLEAAPDSTAGSEYAAYRFVLARLLESCSPVLLRDSIPGYPIQPGQLRDSTLMLYDSSLDGAWRTANTVALRLQVDSLPDTSVVLVPYSPPTDRDWRALRRRYPTGVFTTLFRAGFNSDSTHAVVLVLSQCPVWGHYILARLPGRAWTLWAYEPPPPRDY